ncbi:hypothetical protein [Nocardioides psychrotolerans]|uniref:hypothetical protein n=1 Tax=Nocardioides psychrotolerans TaxID=1005945 RepID=UPI003137BCC8
MSFPPSTTLTRTTFDSLEGVNVNRESDAGLIAQHVGRFDRESDFNADLVLVNDGTGCAGTFGVVVRALLTDVLARGPVRAMVGYWVDPAPAAGRPHYSFVMATGVIERHDGDTIEFTDGHRITLGADLVAVLV